MSNLLLLSLQEKNWEAKYVKYQKYFDFVEYLSIQKNPEISVVVISWRIHPDTLRNFQELVKQRQTENFELIFVDNGGKLGEFDELKPYIDTYVRLNENSGVCISRNIGTLFAKAPLLLFLEDDSLPDCDLLHSHRLLYKTFDVISARGVCITRTNDPNPRISSNYFLGELNFPYYMSIEGNTSIVADIFYRAQGWNDNLFFGMEGLDLSLRLLSIEPDKTKQIYSSAPVIFHDFYRGRDHFDQKHKQQWTAYQALQDTYPDMNRHISDWQDMFQQSELIPIKTNPIEMESLIKSVYERNKCQIKSMTHSYLPTYDFNKASSIFEKVEACGRSISIFGSGMLGQQVLKVLQRHQVHINCFFDNDQKKYGQLFWGIEIKNPATITKSDFIVVASLWSDEISKQLEGLGLTQDLDYIVMK